MKDELAAARQQVALLTEQLGRFEEEAAALLYHERAQIEARLADPALYAPGRAGEITAANQRLAQLAREAEEAEAAWLAAEEALEAAA